MNLFSSRPAEAYIPPLAQPLYFEIEGVLCESPLPGGNEGIGFEDWK